MATVKKTTWRCDEVLISLVLREYDASGRPMNEQIVSGKTSDGSMCPLKVYRAQAPDFWALVDETTKKFTQDAK